MSGLSRFVAPRLDGGGHFSVAPAGGGVGGPVAPITGSSGVRPVEASGAHVGGSVVHRGAGGEGGLSDDPNYEDPPPDEYDDEGNLISKKPRRRRRGGGGGGGGGGYGGDFDLPAAPTDVPISASEVCEDWETGDDPAAVWNATAHLDSINPSKDTLFALVTSEYESPSHSLHCHIVHYEVEAGGILTTNQGSVTFDREFTWDPVTNQITLHFWYKSSDLTEDFCLVDLSTDDWTWELAVPGRYDIANIGPIATFVIITSAAPVVGASTGLSASAGWNEVTLVVDGVSGDYVSLEVNGTFADLSAYAGQGGPFSEYDVIDVGFTVGGARAAHDGSAQTTTFDMYFDDMCLTPAAV